MTNGRRLTTTEGVLLLVKRLFGRGNVRSTEFDSTDIEPVEPQPKQELPGESTDVDQKRK